MNEPEVIEALVDLGLGTGEAKVYLALVTGGSESATPLSKRAEVPQPKVYEYLKALVAKGCVSEMNTPSRAKVYEAISPSIVMEHLENELHNKAKQAENFLIENRGTKKQGEEPVIDFISGSENVSRRIEDLIIKTKKNIVFFSSRYYTSFFEDMQSKYGLNLDFYQIKISITPELRANFRKKIDPLLGIQPSVMFMDVDMNTKTCAETTIFTPRINENEAIMAIFRNSFAPGYQFSLVLTAVELFPMLEIVKL